MRHVYHPLVSGWFAHRWPLQEILFRRKIFVLWGFKGIVFVSSTILACGRRKKNAEMRSRFSKGGGIREISRTAMAKVIST